MRKITHNDAYIRDSKCGVLRLEPYTTSDIKTKYRCPICGDDWFVIPSNIWYNNVRSCQKCRPNDSKPFSEEEATKNDLLVGMYRIDKYIGNDIKVRYLCSICKNEFQATPSQVWRGCKGHTMCYRKHTYCDNHHKFGGYGFVSLKLFTQIKRNAIKRNIEFSKSLTPKYLHELFIDQKAICPYSGEVLILHSNTSKLLNEATASLDRIDSNKNIGYIEGNVHWIHKSINIMKMAMNENEFLDWILKIARYRRLI